VKNIRIVIISSYEMVRRGIRGMLENEKDMEIAGDFTSVSEALKQISAIRPNIVILDNQTPGMNLSVAVNSLKNALTGTDPDIIVLGDIIEQADISLQAGSEGFLLKNSAGTMFIRTIRQIYRDSSDSRRSGSSSEEVVELIIPAPVDSARLFRFITELGNLLLGSFESILGTTGSWDTGTVITIRGQTRMPYNLAIELANMSEVDRVEEVPSPKEVPASAAEDHELLHRLGINPTRRIRITLR
jgi:CheY-like chemotaxis protein